MVHAARPFWIGGLACALAGAALVAAMPDGAPLASSTALMGVLAALGAIGSAFLLAADRRTLFLVIIVLRAACDPLFDAIKSADNGSGVGIGAALNALVILIAALYVLQRPRPFLREVLPMWKVFLLVALLASAIAPERGNAIRLFMVQLSDCAVYAIAFYVVRSQADARRWLLVILASSVLPVAVALSELAAGGAGVGEETFRLYGTFNHPNIFAFYLVLMLTLILYLQKKQGPPLPPLARAALWIYGGLMLGLLVGTKTRSAWAACLLVFLVYGLLYRRRFALLTLCIPALLLLEPGVRERLLDVASNNELGAATDLNSYAWRLILWRSGLEWMEPSHSLLGYGLDSFKYYSPQFFPLEGRDTWDPHNVYIQLFFEAGVAGLLGFGILFWRLLLRLKRAFPADRTGITVVLSGVAAYLMVAYADNLLYYLSFNWYFWFFNGVVCAAAALPREHRAPA
jgi:putative inorganic carbon (HCO3(-)) transporter